MASRIKNFFLGISIFILVVTAWGLLSALHVIPVWSLPPPSQALVTFLDLTWNGTLLKLLLNSLLNLLPAFVFSLVFAVSLGTLIGVNTTVRRMFTPFLAAINAVPSLAWLPLIILFLGFTRQSIWAVIFLSSFIKMIYSIISGVRGINSSWLLVAKNLELTKLGTIVRVVLPGALPQILSGVRIGFGSAWRSLIGAEMLMVSAGGLGKYIWMSQWTFRFDQVIAGVLVIALVGIIAEQVVFKKIEQFTVTRWGMIGEE